VIQVHLCIHDLVDPTNNAKCNKIKIGEVCIGVTAVKDKIYIGGKDKVIILNTDESRVREITTQHGTTVIPQGSLVNDISSS
jgi:hypothetical protein